MLIRDLDRKNKQKLQYNADKKKVSCKCNFWGGDFKSYNKECENLPPLSKVKTSLEKIL